MNSGRSNPGSTRKRKRYGVRELLLRSPLTIYRSRLGVRRAIQPGQESND